MFRKLTAAERDTLTTKLDHASDRLFAEGDTLNRATPAVWASYHVPGPSVFYSAAAEASALIIDVIEDHGPPEYEPDDGEPQRIAEVFADARAEQDRGL